MVSEVAKKVICSSKFAWKLKGKEQLIVLNVELISFLMANKYATMASL